MTDLPAWLQAVRQQQARNQPAWQRTPEAQPGYTPPRPRRTPLTRPDEMRFQRQYAQQAQQFGLDPNPDAPEHHYDYRGAFAAGEGPGADGHWPSQFKDEDHPNRYVVDGGVPVDSITGAPVSAVHLDFNRTPPRPRPRQMRPPLQRLYDPNQGVRDQAAAEVRLGRDVSRTDERAAGGYSGYADRNQVEEFGRSAVEATGAPAWARGIRNVQHGRPGEAIPDFLVGAMNTTGLATLPLGGGARAASTRAPMGMPPRPPPPRMPPTRIYRGINHEHDPTRSAALGDRWWHTNPEVASTYAPGSDGAHVVPGLLDENALNLAHIETPPGTMWRAIPVESLPSNIRRAFPRGTTHVTTQEVTSAAETAGYDGVTFTGMRDSGFANAIEGAYPGFGTGDDGRVVFVARDNVVRSPFPESPLPQRPPQPAVSGPDAGAPGAPNLRIDMIGPDETGSYNVAAFDGDKLAGRVDIWPDNGGFIPEGAQVLPAYQRQRVMTRLLEEAERRLGQPLGRPRGMTDEGGAMWSAYEARRAPQSPDGGAAGGGDGFTVFHGSPHRFDRFSSEHMGTGEGAQSRGRGLYFAENPTVSGTYRFNDVRFEQSPARIARDILGDTNGDYDAAIAQVEAELHSDPGRPMWQEALDLLRLRDIPEGYLYETQIAARADDFLDLDAPISQQSAAVRNLAPRSLGDITGQRLVEWLRRNGRNPDAALRQAGVPGVRYLDQGSRDAGAGTRNYVLFDENLARIISRNGERIPNAPNESPIQPKPGPRKPPVFPGRRNR